MSHSASASSHHVIPPRVYLIIFGLLCVLTVITVVAATFDFGVFNTLVALGIATGKATLVVLYFMHARYSGALTALVIASSVAFLIILIFLTLTDYVSRAWSL